MSFQDKTLTCSDCSKSFTFTVEEQEQFQQKGYTNEPKRCPECRQARKADRGESPASIYNSRQTYPATCSDCGKATTVPFEPKQGRPVYCSNCYRKVRVSR